MSSRVPQQPPPNLVCSNGHHHWSPTPELWHGRDCGHGEGRTLAGTMPVRGRCRETLHEIETTA